jgi:hypothetical protein
MIKSGSIPKLISLLRISAYRARTIKLLYVQLLVRIRVKVWVRGRVKVRVRVGEASD